MAELGPNSVYWEIWCSFYVDFIFSARVSCSTLLSVIYARLTLCYPIVIFLNNNPGRAWRARLTNIPVTMLYWLVKIPFLKETMVCFSRHVQVQVFKLCWNHYCTDTGELLKQLNCVLRKQPQCRQWRTSTSCPTLAPSTISLNLLIWSSPLRVSQSF